MIGYDLDGVIQATPVKLYPFLRRFKPILYLGALICPLKHRPLPNSIIITGRNVKDKFVTDLWLRLHGISNAVFYNPQPYSKESAIIHKAIIINLLGVKIYFEDDPEIGFNPL